MNAAAHLKRIKNLMAKGQKFCIGDYVRINKKLPSYMGVHPKGLIAKVIKSDKFYNEDCNEDTEAYELLVRFGKHNWHSVAWYGPEHLRLVTNEKSMADWELERQR